MLKISTVMLLVGAVAGVANAQTVLPGTRKADVKRIVTMGSLLSAPTDIANAGDGTNRVFVATYGGKVNIWDGTTYSATPFLDISPTFKHQGLTGLTFHPDYATTGAWGEGRFYIATTEAYDALKPVLASPPQGATAGQGVVYEYRASAGNPNLADVATKREVLRVNLSSGEHTLNDVVFDNAGKLLISIGDSADHPASYFNGPNLGIAAGKVLRIDPSGASSYNGQYGSPADNPFVGTPGALSEVYAYGLRNPWKLAKDKVTGDVYIGDVGRNQREEVDALVAGANYGWPYFEGNAAFQPSPPSGLTAPIADYDHAYGASISLGAVYRGAGVDLPQGSLVLGDWSSTSRLMYLEPGSGQIYRFDGTGSTDPLPAWITAVGEGEDGKMYIASLDYFGQRGSLSVFVPEPATLALACGATIVLLRRRA